MMFSRKSVVLCICAGLRVRGDRLGVERRRVDVHAGAGLHDVDDRRGRRCSATVLTTSK